MRWQKEGSEGSSSCRAHGEAFEEGKGHSQPRGYNGCWATAGLQCQPPSGTEGTDPSISEPLGMAMLRTFIH